MRYYPAMLDLTGREVVIVGAGEVALRKARDILDTGARIRVIAPQVHPAIVKLRDELGDRVTLVQREYAPGDCDGAVLIISAANDREVNRIVCRDAMKRNIFINSVDDPDNCTFIVPSHFSRGDLTVCVSTGGASPSMAASIRRRISETLPANIEEVLAALKTARDILKNDELFSRLTQSERASVLNRISASDFLTENMIQRRSDLKCFLKEIIEKKEAPE